MMLKHEGNMVLKGVQVVEFEGLAPIPLAGMMLADLGADVTVIRRPDNNIGAMTNTYVHAKKEIVTANLKTEEGIETANTVLADAHVVLDPFRPHVLSSLAVTIPDSAIVVHVTGYGPDSGEAGHDINYVADSGILSLLPNHRPPINLLADFAGGSLMAGIGVLLALLESDKGGKEVEVSMADGVAYLGAWLSSNASLLFPNPPGCNMLDGGAPFYSVYETKDGSHISVGAIEPAFYGALLSGLGLDPDHLPPQMDTVVWPEMSALFASIFRSRNAEEWTSIFAGTDACVRLVAPPKTHPTPTPVLRSRL